MARVRTPLARIQGLRAVSAPVLHSLMSMVAIFARISPFWLHGLKGVSASVLAGALGNRISGTGVALTTASALLFLFLIALELVGVLQNPYVGILTFVVVPALFVLGLLLIPIGKWIDRRRRRSEAPPPTWAALDLKEPATRRMVTFIAVATVVNLAIISVASYGGRRVRRVEGVLWAGVRQRDETRIRRSSERSARTCRVRVMAPGTRSGGISGSQVERLASALAGRHWRVPPSYSDTDRACARRAIDLRALSRA